MTTDVDFNRAMSTDREADNPCAPRYHCDRQLRRPPPDTSPARLSRNPFATGQTLILFLLESIELNGGYLFFLFILSPLFFYLFLSLHLFFSFHLIYSLFPTFSTSFFSHFLLFLFVLFLSLSLYFSVRYSSRGGCKMIFRNEICNRV